MAKGATITSQIFQPVFTGEWHVISYAMSRKVASSMVYYPAATHVRCVRKLCKISFFLWELCNPILSSILPSYPILREKIVPSCSRYISPLSLARYLLDSCRWHSRHNFCSILAFFLLGCFTWETNRMLETVRTTLHSTYDTAQKNPARNNLSNIPKTFLTRYLVLDLKYIVIFERVCVWVCMWKARETRS